MSAVAEKTSNATERRRNVLPTCVTPTDYHLHITPNFEDFSFTGHVRIHVRTSACTGDDASAHADVCGGGADGAITAIKLNSVELTFDKVSVENAATKARAEVAASAVMYDARNMTATIPLAAPLRAGEEAVLAIEYRGCMNDKLVGFYRSKYKNAQGEEIYMGTTQFESVDARRAFPCWDEPAVKAVFHVTLTAPAHMTALSNTHVVAQHAEASGLVTYTYAPTPRMSTYLVAWIVGELDVITATTRLPCTPAQDTAVSLYAPPGRAAKGQYALDMAVRVLPLYERFFEVGYNLPKLDLVAIPDFAAGAMENWGLVTFRESALLCDEATTTVEKKYVATVVAHELAHQWFGNLVTMSWWKELWLNESFATLMQYRATDELVPEWNIFTEMLQREGSRAMSLDALLSSHPIEVDICEAQEIDDVFDAISYSKGCCILRMIVEYIGDAAFQAGMSRYIQHFSHGNASTVELWRFLGEAAGQDVARIMADWTSQQGFPYLRVQPTADGAGVAVTQHRFLAARTAECDAPTHWRIPLLVAAAGAAECAVVVTGEHGAAGQVLPVGAAAGWVKVNSRQAAFCRVLYADELLARLAGALRAAELGPLDRLGLVGDYAAFAKGGYASSTVVLDLMRALADREDNLSVWTAVVDAEDAVRRVVATRGAAAVARYDAYCQHLYRAAMDRLGYAPRLDEPENDGQLRGMLFARMIAAKDAATLAAARALYAGRAVAPIPQNLLRAVFAVRVREGGAEALAEVQQLADTTAQLSDRHKYLATVAAACPDTLSVAQVFDYAFSPKVRPGEVLYVLAGLAGKAELLRDFAKEVAARWATITRVLPPMLAGRVPKLLEHGADAAVAADMRAFYNGLSEHDKMAVGRSFQQGLEELDTNVQWAARDADAIVSWLPQE